MGPEDSIAACFFPFSSFLPFLLFFSFAAQPVQLKVLLVGGRLVDEDMERGHSRIVDHVDQVPHVAADVRLMEPNAPRRGLHRCAQL